MAIYYADGSNSGTGRQVQVVTATDTTYRSAGTNTDILCVLCNITPKSNDSVILIQAHFTLVTPAEDAIVYLRRAGNNIGSGSYSGINRTGIVGASSRGGGWEMQNGAISYLDSPASTSSIQYSIYARFNGGSGTIAVNRTLNATGGDSNATRSSMILTEVKV